MLNWHLCPKSQNSSFVRDFKLETLVQTENFSSQKFQANVKCTKLWDWGRFSFSLLVIVTKTTRIHLSIEANNILEHFSIRNLSRFGAHVSSPVIFFERLPKDSEESPLASVPMPESLCLAPSWIIRRPFMSLSPLHGRQRRRRLPLSLSPWPAFFPTIPYFINHKIISARNPRPLNHGATQRETIVGGEERPMFPWVIFNIQSKGVNACLLVLLLTGRKWDSKLTLERQGVFRAGKQTNWDRRIHWCKLLSCCARDKWSLLWMTLGPFQVDK